MSYKNIGIIYGTIYAVFVNNANAGIHYKINITNSIVSDNVAKMFDVINSFLDWLPVNMDELNSRLYSMIGMMETICKDIWNSLNSSSRTSISDGLNLIYNLNVIPTKIKFKILDLQDIIKNIKVINATIQVPITVPAPITVAVAVPIHITSPVPIPVDVPLPVPKTVVSIPASAPTPEVSTPVIEPVRVSPWKNIANANTNANATTPVNNTNNTNIEITEMQTNKFNDRYRRDDRRGDRRQDDRRYSRNSRVDNQDSRNRQQKNNQIQRQNSNQNQNNNTISNGNPRKNGNEEVIVRKNMFEGLESNDTNDTNDTNELQSDDDGFIKIERKPKNSIPNNQNSNSSNSSNTTSNTKSNANIYRPKKH